MDKSEREMKIERKMRKMTRMAIIGMAIMGAFATTAVIVGDKNNNLTTVLMILAAFSGCATLGFVLIYPSWQR